MRKFVRIYLLVVVSVALLYSATYTHSEILVNVTLRVLMVNNKPYREARVMVAYNTYYLSTTCREYCHTGVTNSEGYVEFVNITAQRCVTGYCVAIKIYTPPYDVEFVLRNIRVNTPNTSITVRLPFIDVRDRDILIVDEYGNPLEGVFSIYYKDLLVHKVVFTNGLVSLRESQTPLLSYTGRSEVVIEYFEGLRENSPVSSFTEPEYVLEINVKNLKTPYIKRVRSSELINLNRVVIKLDSNGSTEIDKNIGTNIHPNIPLGGETPSNTWSSWFSPSSSEEGKLSINKVLLLTPLLSIAILVYEGLIRRKRGESRSSS